MQELPRKFERQVWLERLASLLELDQLPYIERLTTLWRHSGVSKSTLIAQTQQIERPGLTYCRDPFQEPQLHRVFHNLDNIELSRKVLLQYLSTGTVNIARNGLDYGDFEGFALVILYLQYFLFPSPSAELEDAVSKIQNQVWPVKCYKLKQSTWSSAFTEANLRVYKCKSSADADGISQSNIYLNELLEFIRLRKLEEGALLSSSKLSNEDLQKLGKALASCFFAVIEFAGNSDWIVVQNLQVLSKNGARLPGSWYTSEFLSTTKNLAERFSTQQSAHSTRGLSYIFDLWAFWLRRISRNEHGELGESIVKTMIDTIPLCDDPEMNSILLSTATAMSVSLGKFSDDFDELVGDGLMQCMEQAKVTISADKSDPLFASLAQYLKTAQSKKRIFDISTEFLSLAKTLAIMSNERLEYFIKIFRLYQFVCTSRIKTFQKNSATKVKSAFHSGVPEESSKIQILLDSSRLAMDSDENTMKRIGFMALTGLVKGYQLSPSNLSLNKEIDHELMRSLKQITPEDPIFCDVEDQDLISFVSGQCLSKRLPTERDNLNTKSLVQVLVNTLFYGDNALGFSYLDSLIYAPPTKNESYLRTVALLQKRTKHPIYAEVGRISVVLANLLCQTDKPTIQESIDKIRSFAINLYTEMDRCSVDFLVYENNQFKELEPPLGDMFKNTIFSVTLIYKTLLERIINDDRPISFAICGDMVESLSSLHYMVVRLGGRGFASYETVTKNLMEKLRSDKDIANRVVKNIVPIRYYDEVERNPLRRSRLLFYFNLVDITMDVLDDNLVKQDILPSIYPYLNTNQYQDMFEASHSIVLSIFENKKQVAGELSAYYSSLILTQYPKYLNIEQLREAYTVMMLGLSQSDDAIAWSCLTKLIQEIEGFSEPCTPNQTEPSKDDSNSEQSAALYLARGHLLLTLFDQIKSVNLVLLESLLKTIKHLLLTEPKSAGRDAICKALYDNVSNGLDYTKKESTIKWYLNLMKDLGENIRP